MGNVIPLKKEVKNSYFELKNYFAKEIEKVDTKIFHKLDSEVKLVQKLTDHHFSSKGKQIRAHRVRVRNVVKRVVDIAIDYLYFLLCGEKK